ncbi:MAG: M28 family peptidase, partial [Bacteroidota bacterium]
VLHLLRVFGQLHTTHVSEDKAAVMRVAREHARNLAAPEMAGRGYQDEGHLKAAKYIAAAYEKMGLEPVPALKGKENPYFQPFRIALNLIQTPLHLTIDKKEMEIGKDYIVKASSGRGTLENLKIKDLGHGMPEKFSKSFKGKIVLFRSGLPKDIAASKELKDKYKRFASDDVKVDYAVKMQAEGVIILKEKLTAGLSKFPVEIPVVEVVADRLPRKKAKKASLTVSAGVKAINTQNVMGMLPGTVHKDSVIIVCGHYDHLGTQGDAIFYGGNDNASGTSMILSMADHFSKPQNRPNYTMLFLAYSAEECGLLGSKHYVETEPLIPLEQTAFVLNIDLMGNGDKGINVVAGLDFLSHWERLKALNDQLESVPIVKKRRNAPNSDHYWFVKNGVKAFFIYTMGGPPHYHDINDTYENLTFSKYYEVRELLIAYLKQLMGKK